MLLNALGYEHNYFVTFNQVQNMGGKIKKGETSEIIVYWQMPERQKDESEEDFAKRKPRLHYHRVFNISQCQDIPPVFIPEPYKWFNKPIDICEEIVAKCQIARRLSMIMRRRIITEPMTTSISLQ